MRYMCYTLGNDSGGFPPPGPELVAKMDELIEDGKKAGIFVVMGGLAPSDTTTKVTNVGGKLTAIDGPFAEAKEIIGGFAIIDVPSKEDAIAWTKRFLSIVGEGESNIREIYSD